MPCLFAGKAMRNEQGGLGHGGVWDVANLGCGTVWDAAGFGMWQGLGCGRIWEAAGFGMQQFLGWGKVWDAAGFGMRKVLRSRHAPGFQGCLWGAGDLSPLRCLCCLPFNLLHPAKGPASVSGCCPEVQPAARTLRGSAAWEPERDERWVRATARSKERAGIFFPSYLLTTVHLTGSIFQARE